VPGLRCRPSHPVTGKAIEHFPESGENSFKPFLNVRLLMCGIASDRGLLAKLTAICADDAIGMRGGSALILIGEI
jgi:hypothetical protein